MSELIFHRRRRGRGRIVAIFLAMLAIVAAWTAGLIAFTGAIPETVDEPGRYTDAIVVLTGGSERLETGLGLLADKRAGRLYVSGVYRGVDVKQLLALSREAPEELACCIEIGHDADDTIGNAAETARWIAEKDMDSMRLVTASYHMPRSMAEFRHAMPPNVDIIAHPVFPAHVKQGEWWAWPGTAWLLIREYNKFLLARLRHIVEDLARGAGAPLPTSAGGPQ